MIRIGRKSRIWIYLIAIVLCVLEIRFHILGNLWKQMAVRTVQFMAVQTDRELPRSWLGIEMLQCGSDLLTYADLIYRIKPDVIIETGTRQGGLAVFFATLLEKVNPESTVVTVDIDDSGWVKTIGSGKVPESLRNRIVFIQGDSVSDSVLRRVEAYAQNKRCLVMLDSLHTGDHVLNELTLYSRFVAVGSYMIVHDTNIESLMGIRDKIILYFNNPNLAGEGGPLKAIREFIRQNDQFVIDDQLPQTILSLVPSGFVKRVKPLRPLDEAGQVSLY